MGSAEPYPDLAADPGLEAEAPAPARPEALPGRPAGEARAAPGRIRALLRRTEESEFLLLERGFRWINEVPFNR